ncbi:MAG TPA: hypothetical protein VLS27_07670 [Gammaproteobacteria bacterium]|nr:hypothetical protein [Gammaproteobacteria bacterium]
MGRGAPHDLVIEHVHGGTVDVRRHVGGAPCVESDYARFAFAGEFPRNLPQQRNRLVGSARHRYRKPVEHQALCLRHGILSEILKADAGETLSEFGDQSQSARFHCGCGAGRPMITVRT